MVRGGAAEKSDHRGHIGVGETNADRLLEHSLALPTPPERTRADVASSLSKQCILEASGCSERNWARLGSRTRRACRAGTARRALHPRERRTPAPARSRPLGQSQRLGQRLVRHRDHRMTAIFIAAPEPDGPRSTWPFVIASSTGVASSYASGLPRRSRRAALPRAHAARDRSVEQADVVFGRPPQRVPVPARGPIVPTFFGACPLQGGDPPEAAVSEHGARSVLDWSTSSRRCREWPGQRAPGDRRACEYQGGAAVRRAVPDNGAGKPAASTLCCYCPAMRPIPAKPTPVVPPTLWPHSESSLRRWPPGPARAFADPFLASQTVDSSRSSNSLPPRETYVLPQTNSPRPGTS